jgi:hypothetical protein
MITAMEVTESGSAVVAPFTTRLPHSLTHKPDHKEARVKYFRWIPDGSTAAKNSILSLEMVSLEPDSQ